jgi:hypothetical protein
MGSHGQIGTGPVWDWIGELMTGTFPVARQSLSLIVDILRHWRMLE